MNSIAGQSPGTSERHLTNRSSTIASVRTFEEAKAIEISSTPALSAPAVFKDTVHEGPEAPAQDRAHIAFLCLGGRSMAGLAQPERGVDDRPHRRVLQMEWEDGTTIVHTCACDDAQIAREFGTCHRKMHAFVRVQCRCFDHIIRNILESILPNPELRGDRRSSPFAVNSWGRARRSAEQWQKYARGLSWLA